MPTTTLRNLMRISALLILAGLIQVERSGGQQSTATREVDAAFRALDPRSLAVVETYLRTDCELGEEGVALKDLLAIAGQVEPVVPYLRAVVQQGPPSSVRGELQRSLDAAWAARQKFFETPEARELGEESFRMMQSISKEDYVRSQREALDAKYRERAALALRRIEGEGKYPA